ncbi:MAG: ABC transporter permease [Candidatus Eisenbacteria bacterium]
MRAMWIIMRKDLLRRWRAPLAPIVFLLFPFIFSGLIALAFGSGDSARAPRFRLALVDEDGGFVAGLVRGALGQEQAARYLDVVETSLPEALRAIERNRISGAIVLPAGFTASVWGGAPAHVRVIRNPAQAIGPVAVEETAEFMALLLSGAGDLLAEPMQRIRAEIAAGHPTPADGGSAASGAEGWARDRSVADIAVMMNHVMHGAGRYLMPPRIRIEKASAPGIPSPPAAAADAAGASGDESAQRSASTFNTVFQYVLPGMAAFALFILAVGLSADIFAERRAWTLPRQLAAPVRARELIFGKMLATMAVGLLVSVAMALIGALLLGARADLLAFGLFIVAFLLALTGFVALLYGFARSEQRGATLASIVLMIMAFLGGSFIPLDTLPGFVQRLAPFTLNYWAIEGLRTLLFTDGGITEIARPLFVLLAVGLTSGFLGAAFLQRQLAGGD